MLDVFHFAFTLCMSQDGEATDSKCEDDFGELEEREQILQEVNRIPGKGFSDVPTSYLSLTLFCSLLNP